MSFFSYFGMGLGLTAMVKESAQSTYEKEYEKALIEARKKIKETK